MVERLLDPVHVHEEAVVAQQLVESLLVDGAQELDGAALQGVELLVVDAAEQGNGFVIPAPPHVVGQLVQGLQALGQMGQYREGANSAARHQYLVGRVRPFSKHP